MNSHNNLPEQFLIRLEKIFPQDKHPVLVETFYQKRPTTFRINTLKTEPETVLDILGKEQFHLSTLSWPNNAYIIPDTERKQLVDHQLHQNGMIYIQDLASMIPALLLQPSEEDEVLDLTAAPGSKTIQMASLMKNQGRIIAIESVKPRFFKLKANIEKNGVLNTKLYLTDGRLVWRKNASRFDKVLLDAPCSSEARFNTHHPESYKFWSKRKIEETSRKQKQLIYSAFQCLKKEGKLLYSTCSFSPEENEMIVHHLLKKFGDAAQVLPLSIPLQNIQAGLTTWGNKHFRQEVKNTIRILPTQQMHGFFCALIKKVL